MQRLYISAPGIVTTSFLLLIGCVSTPPPLEDIARASTTVDLAEQSNAQDYAPLELGSAQHKLSQARAAMANEDYVTARQLAEQAQVEAELAQVKSQSAVARQSLQQVRESIRILREEIGPAEMGGRSPIGAGAY